MFGKTSLFLITALIAFCGVAQAESSDSSTATAAAKPRKVRPTKKAEPKKPKSKTIPVAENLLKSGAIGIKASLNSAWMYSDANGYDDLDSMTAWQVGISYDKRMNDFLSYRIEGAYSRKGAKISDADTELTMDYIEVPAMLVGRVRVTPKITAYVTGGAYAAFLAGVEQKVNGELVKRAPDKNGNEKKIEEFYSSLDYGLNFGAGAWFPVSKAIMASAEFRYVHGLADLANHDTVSISEDDPLTNRNFLLTVGIHFGGFGGK